MATNCNLQFYGRPARREQADDVPAKRTEPEVAATAAAAPAATEAAAIQNKPI